MELCIQQMNVLALDDGIDLHVYQLLDYKYNHLVLKHNIHNIIIFIINNSGNLPMLVLKQRLHFQCFASMNAANGLM